MSGAPFCVSCSPISKLLESARVGETLRFALRLSDGICKVTLYSVCRSSSSAMKQASCTRRFARTICSLRRRRLLTNSTSLDGGGEEKGGGRQSSEETG